MKTTDRGRIGRVQTSRNDYVEIHVLPGARRRCRLVLGTLGDANSRKKISLDLDTFRARAVFELLGAALKVASLADEQYQDDLAAKRGN